MAEITLPANLGNIWASSGDVLKPSDNKILQGWSAEIPPRQWFNWLDNRQDQAIAHIAQHGISVWSSTIEYQANKSYVQGSDGIVYKALTTNTNINPVGGASGNWQSAFISADQATKVATAAQSRAMTANDVFLSPLQLANAFTGSNQNLSTNGFQKYPGGLLEIWGQVTLNVPNNVGSITSANVTFATPVPNSILNITIGINNGVGGTDFIECNAGFLSTTLTGGTISALRLYGSNTGSETIVVNYLIKAI